MFAGDSVTLVQVTDADEFRVQTAGNAPFPGIVGNLSVQLGSFVGPWRIVMHWDIDRYVASVPGMYSYMLEQLGVPTAVRFSGAPV